MNLKRLRVNTPKSLWIILGCSLFLNIFGIWWGIPSWRGWTADEITPGHVLQALSQGFSQGWHLRYPPFHLYLMTIIYSPILVILFFLDKLQLIDLNQFPILYQKNTIDQLLFAFYTLFFYIGRFVTVLMGTSAVYVVYKCGREIYDEKSSIFAALIVTLLWPVCFYSKTMNLDIPYLFWFCFSLLFYLRILKFHRIVDYCLFSITAVFAICTKDQAYALYILPALMIIISFYKFKKKQHSTFSILQLTVEKNLIIPLVISIVLFCLIHNVIFNWTGFVKHFQLITGPASQDYQLFKASWSGYFKLYRLVTKDIIYSLQFPIFCICMGGIIFTLFKKPRIKLLWYILLPCLSYYIFFITVILYHYIRFALPLCYSLAFFGGRGISQLWDLKKYRYVSRLTIILALFFSLGYPLSLNILMINDSRYQVEDWVMDNIDQQSTLLAVGPLQYLPRFELTHNNIKWLRNRESSFSKFQSVRDYDFLLSDLSLYDFEKHRFDYLIVSGLSKKAYTKVFFIIEELENKANIEYKLVYKFQSFPWFNFFPSEGVLSINPIIEIYALRNNGRILYP